MNTYRFYTADEGSKFITAIKAKFEDFYCGDHSYEIFDAENNERWIFPKINTIVRVQYPE